MFAAIMTWAGAMLGVAILLLMAFGSVANDFEKPRIRRRDREPAEKPGS